MYSQTSVKFRIWHARDKMQIFQPSAVIRKDSNVFFSLWNHSKIHWTSMVIQSSLTQLAQWKDKKNHMEKGSFNKTFIRIIIYIVWKTLNLLIHLQESHAYLQILCVINIKSMHTHPHACIYTCKHVHTHAHNEVGSKLTYLHDIIAFISFT